MNNKINQWVRLHCHWVGFPNHSSHHRGSQGSGFYDLEWKSFCYKDGKLRPRERKGLGLGHKDNYKDNLRPGFRSPEAYHTIVFSPMTFHLIACHQPLELSQCLWGLVRGIIISLSLGQSSIQRTAGTARREEGWETDGIQDAREMPDQPRLSL